MCNIYEIDLVNALGGYSLRYDRTSLEEERFHWLACKEGESVIEEGPVGRHQAKGRPVPT